MLRNFPLQANGAEMLRLACCLATESGICVCVPLHDALLIEAPLADLDDAVRATHEHMAEASRIVLDGFELRTDAKMARHPERYRDLVVRISGYSAYWSDLTDEMRDEIIARTLHAGPGCGAPRPGAEPPA